jgi:hypothetical protein
MIQNVKELRPELYIPVFGKIELTAQCQIPLPHWKAAQSVASK